jgi:aminoglycoside phosphotransferase
MTVHPAADDNPGDLDRNDPLTLRRIYALTHQICRRNGLDPTGAHLIKFTINAVVALPEAGAVLRIAGSAPTRARLPAVIAAARWFAEHDLPTVRLWPDLEQPLNVDGHRATVWQQTPAGGPSPTPADLAATLLAIHELDDPPDLPRWAPMEGMRRRLGRAVDVDAATLDLLTDRCITLDHDLAALHVEPLIPPGVIHGDAHLGNLIAAPAGPVLCDFDSTGIGPREWDLAPAAAGAVRFDYGPRVHNELSAAYGVDITTWPGFPILRRVRELQMVISVLPLLGANPALRPQWEHRLATLDQPDADRPWTPYSNLRT